MKSFPQLVLETMLERGSAVIEITVVIGDCMLPRMVQGDDLTLVGPCTMLQLEPGNPHNNQGFALTAEGFSALMSFGGQPFNVEVPWGGILALKAGADVVGFPRLSGPPSEPKPKLRAVR